MRRPAVRSPAPFGLENVRARERAWVSFGAHQARYGSDQLAAAFVPAMKSYQSSSMKRGPPAGRHLIPEAWYNQPRSKSSTAARCRVGTWPIRRASAAATVAILVVRISDGIGSPVALPETATSPGQPRFSALVIISTQSRSDNAGAIETLLISRLGSMRRTTSAGRRWRVGRSV